MGSFFFFSHPYSKIFIKWPASGWSNGCVAGKDVLTIGVSVWGGNFCRISSLSFYFLGTERLHGGDVNFHAVPLIKRYAGVLLEFCEDFDIRKAFEKDCQDLRNVIQKDPEGWRFLTSPLVSKTQKQRLLFGLAKHLKFSKLMQGFLGLLVCHRRLPMFEEVVVYFFEKMALRTDACQVRLITARALSEQETETLQEILHKTLHKQIQLVPEIQSDILGGLVLLWEQFRLDASVATGLKRLRQQLQAES
ncbi:MAG: ATP synthase F1 subunit delta [Alphaproteobacteria bacterium]